jgi:hypothetical protein
LPSSRTPASAAGAVSTTRVSFQNSNDGYAGTFDGRIADHAANNTDGSTAQELFIDGANITQTDSFDSPCMIKFAGAEEGFREIIKAEMVFVTGVSSGADRSFD